jgi:hypothetical protein
VSPEPSWKTEMRQVRGIPLPDPVDKQLRRWSSQWKGWNPTPEEYMKVAAVVAVVGVLVYAYACSKSTTVSHG